MILSEKDTVRFWTKVDKKGPDECWEWTAAKHRQGYGFIWAAGKQMTAHRVSWIITFGNIHVMSHVLHRCDNPPCVNPSHLFLGSHSDNVSDMDRKGRRKNVYLNGMSNGRAKLTEENVQSIHHFLKLKTPHSKIAKHFGVSKSAISMISRGVNWSHIMNK